MKKLDAELENVRSMYKRIVLNVILPLILGVFLYVLYRKGDLIIFEWLNNSYISGLQKYMGIGLKWSFKLPNWIIYSFPDGLWAYALSYTIIIVWNKSMKPVVLVLLTCLLGVSVEIFQLLKIISGTFDLVDVALSVIAVISAYLAVNYKKIFRGTVNEKVKA